MKEVLRASYDRSADRYDEEFRPLQREKFAALLGADASLVRPGARVLDLGCGTGLLSEWLAEARLRPAHRIVGVDFSHAMVARARARGVAAVQGDVDALPFRDGAFDAVLAFTVLGILPGSPARPLAEAARVVPRSGILVVSLLRKSWSEGFEADLRAAGFVPGRRVACGQDYGYQCRRT